MTTRELERIAALETQVAMLVKQQDAQAEMLREVRDAVVTGKGARLALLSLVGVSGIIGGLISTFMPR